MIAAVYGYDIRKGDVLGVWVYGYPDLTSSSIYVGPQGEITIPPLGRIKAEGMSIEALQELLEQKMKEYIRSARVTVGVVQYAPFKVSVFGNTKVQGYVDIKAESVRLSELVASLGGLADPMKTSYVLIRYPDGKESKVSMDWIFNGTKGDDPLITENSYVLFPLEYNNNVSVFTEQISKSLEYRNGMTLSDIISGLGISISQVDDSITVLNSKEIKSYSLRSVIEGEKVFLEKGDTVIINRLKKFVYLFSPAFTGKIDFEKNEPMSLKKVILSVNLQLSQANDMITVIRGSQKESYSLERVINGFDVELQSGDVIQLEKYSKYVYLFSSSFSGKLDFEKSDEMTMKKLIAKSGIVTDQYEDNVVVIRDSLKLEYQIQQIKQGGDFQLLNGDIVQFSRVKKYVYAFSPTYSGRVDFEKDEDMSIRRLISRTGLQPDVLDERISVSRGSRTINLNLSEVMRTNDFTLQTDDVVQFFRSERYVYVFSPSFNGKIDFEKNQDMTLRRVIAKISLSAALVENEIEVSGTDGTRVYNLNDVMFKEDVLLQSKDIIKFSKYKNYVYVFTPSSSLKIDFEKNDDITLRKVITRNNIPIDQLDDKAVIIRDGETTEFSLSKLLSGEDKELCGGDIIKFSKYKKSIYVFTYSMSSRTEFDKSEPVTLRKLFARLNVPLQTVQDNVQIIRGTETTDIDLSQESAFETELADGDIVRLNKISRYVYVFTPTGTVKAEFEKNEPMSISRLVSKIGIVLDTVQDTVTISRNSEEIEFSLAGIKKGQDFDLFTGDMLRFEKFRKSVYVFSPAFNGKVDFEKSDEMTLRKVISRVSIPLDTVKNEVTIVFNNESSVFALTDILQGKDIVLKADSIIRFDRYSGYVYAVMDSKSTRVEFEKRETITPRMVCSKLGINPENVRSLSIDSKTVSMDEGIMPGIFLDIKLYENTAYIMGDLSANINYPFGSTLLDLLVPYQLSESYIVSYNTEKDSGTLSATQTQLMNDIKLKGKVYIQVNKIYSDEVTVYKEGQNFLLKNKKVRLIDVMSACGGFAPVDRGYVNVYLKNEKVASYTEKDVFTDAAAEIPAGAYVVVQPELKYSYITVLGSVSPRSIKSERPLSLVEILAGSSINWSVQDKIYIYEPGSEKKEVDISRPEELSKVFVNPGSLVYIPSADTQIVYVFGQVARPGMVQYVKGFTLVDALLKAGNPVSCSELSTVYLFQNGPEQPPVVLDISQIVSSGAVKNEMNPQLKPGDIIFVPKNMLTSVKEVMSTVTTFLGFMNTSIDSYNKIKELIK
jgi:protein involved in polysaccharide export with SLBB domain